jgi:hypothetical protein
LCLSHVANGIGKTLYVDSTTETNKRLAFAPIFVEVDVDLDFPEEV